MRHVAVGFICNEEQQLLTAQRLDHVPQEVELLGGVVRMGETPPCALDRELKEEIDARVNHVGRIASWRTLHHGAPTAFEIFHVEVQAGSNVHAREEETHSELAWRSVEELRRMTMAPALGQVVKWLVDKELKRQRKNGILSWYIDTPSGINGVS
jgi:mutator protein MutT